MCTDWFKDSCTYSYLFLSPRAEPYFLSFCFFLFNFFSFSFFHFFVIVVFVVVLFCFLKMLFSLALYFEGYNFWLAYHDFVLNHLYHYSNSLVSLSLFSIPDTKFHSLSSPLHSSIFFSLFKVTTYPRHCICPIHPLKLQTLFCPSMPSSLHILNSIFNTSKY